MDSPDCGVAHDDLVALHATFHPGGQHVTLQVTFDVTTATDAIMARVAHAIDAHARQGAHTMRMAANARLN